MKILFVSERCPWPLIDGGNLRTYHVLKALAERHEVTLLCHNNDTGHGEPLGDLEQICRVVSVDKPTTGMVKKAVSLVRALLGPVPYNVLKGWSPPLFNAYRQLLAKTDFDVVHYNHYDTAFFARHLAPPHKAVFDTHNVVSDIVGRMADAQPSAAMRSALHSQTRKMAHLEGDLCGLMDRVMVCSVLDADGFKTLNPDGHYVVVDNGVDTEFFSPKEAATAPGKLCFTGAMGYFPNEDGMLWFHDRIAPLIAAAGTDFSLSVVGGGPSDKLKTLHDGSRFNVTGFVDDVRPYMAEAALCIVPLRIAGGTRLKILEAFAMGKAVVSTPEGAEGLNAVPGEEILIADTPQKFAEAVCYLLAHPEVAQRMGERGRIKALAEYDWQIIGKKVVAEYDAVAQG